MGKPDFSETDATADVERLRAENARLIALLEAQGINWQASPPRVVAREPVPGTKPSRLSTEDKIALFRRLFRGRTDIYPVRWESKVGKSGYSPACANEWKRGICEKPRIKCSDCPNQAFLPVTGELIYDHLAGTVTAGVYPLLSGDTCHFLAVDFDEADWREDARAFAHSCRELDVPVALEVSRSGNGAHAWIFFSMAVAAREARRLGTAIISHTCARTRQLALSSYDRFFPNQDTMPKGGFGNLIALPLQKKPREQNRSVFVDEKLQPYSDQWAFLASVRRLAPEAIEATILRATAGTHPLDVTFIAEEDQYEPWKRPAAGSRKLPGPMPTSLAVTLANQIYFQKDQVPQPLANRLIRLAAFQNPEFYRAQAMRFPVWDKPRVIGCAENFPRYIALPRGCLEPVKELLRDNDIKCDIRDERFKGDALSAAFAGDLRADQQKAVAQMLRHDIGVLCAPTAFGKTVISAAMIARRGVNTLVLVHRTELLRQWRERLCTFLAVGKEVVGTIGGGKPKPTGKIDIAVMQSLSRKGKISDLVENYGQVIVDECHHLSAFSFEAIMKRARAKYVLGLTATPIRRDGQQPIIFMQCGPIRHTAAKAEGAVRALDVIPRLLTTAIDLPDKAGIQDVFRRLAEDPVRTRAIAADIVHAYRKGRKVLVLTERTDHLELLKTALGSAVQSLFLLHGRISKKQRAELIVALDALPGDAPRVLLATGRLVGEGFDHPPLDTLVLAMPISWKGTLQQYAGRLHRTHATKTNVQISDYIDAGHPALMRMWDKRQRGYRAMGYRITEPPKGSLDFE